jgi:hypothetical protein
VAFERRCEKPIPVDHPPAQSGIPPTITTSSSTTEKVALFRRLFSGRPDIFPLRWEDRKAGRSGYFPACTNEWARDMRQAGKMRRMPASGVHSRIRSNSAVHARCRSDRRSSERYGVDVVRIMVGRGPPLTDFSGSESALIGDLVSIVTGLAILPCTPQRRRRTLREWYNSFCP